MQERSIEGEAESERKEKENGELEIVFEGEEKEESRRFLFIEMEFCEFLSLDNYLRPVNPRGELSLKAIFLIFNQILEALVFIHSKKIAHLDLNPRNVLITKNKLKLGDFGLAQALLSGRGVSLVEGCGHYLAPELEAQRTFHLNSDVYSLGIMLFELLAQFKTNSERIQKLVLFKKTHAIPRDLSKGVHCVYNLLTKMLARDPEHRIGSLEILSDPDYLAWKRLSLDA